MLQAKPSRIVRKIPLISYLLLLVPFLLFVASTVWLFVVILLNYRVVKVEPFIAFGIIPWVFWFATSILISATIIIFLILTRISFSFYEYAHKIFINSIVVFTSVILQACAVMFAVIDLFWGTAATSAISVLLIIASWVLETEENVEDENLIKALALQLSKDIKNRKSKDEYIKIYDIAANISRVHINKTKHKVIKKDIIIKTSDATAKQPKDAK